MRSTPTVLLVLLTLLLATEIVAASELPWRPILIRRGDEYRIYRVTAAGKVAPLELSIQRIPEQSGSYGSSVPVLSPDGGTLAYVWQKDVWLLDLDSRQELRVTDVRNDSGATAGCVTNFMCWSPDGTRFLYSVTRETVLDGPAPGPCEASGVFLYDLEKRASSPANFRGAFQCWRAGDEIVVSGDAQVDFSWIAFLPTGDLWLCDLSTGERTRRITGDGQSRRARARIHDGRRDGQEFRYRQPVGPEGQVGSALLLSAGFHLRLPHGDKGVHGAL